MKNSEIRETLHIDCGRKPSQSSMAIELEPTREMFPGKGTANPAKGQPQWFWPTIPDGPNDT